MAESIGREVRAACERAVHDAFGTAARIVATTALAGDASSRRYVRLVLAGPGVPASAVAMVLGEGRFAPGSDELGGGIVIDELPFLNVGRWLAARGFPVPVIYHDAARRDGLLLLEDVGDTTLWAAAGAAPAAAAGLFARAVDLLATLQAEGARHPDPGCYAFRRRFDPRLARRELEHFVEHGIETRRGRPLAPAARAALLDALAAVAAPFAAPDPVLVHRDFMAWNLHVQDGRLRLLDFQDALLGPDAYDLAALLTDRTTATLIDPPLEAELLARFTAARAAAGLPLPGEVAARYRLCALHRALKVIGRFHFLELVQGKPGYLAYLPAVYAVGRRMLAALPALAGLQDRLAEHVPELAAA
ncbi:MAG TPA: phosphotransferase [Candidatus Binatia bacterium]|nr:phosphotransferase [Candidatus Binatia bacterium]